MNKKSHINHQKSKYTGVFFYPYENPQIRWHSAVSVDGERVSCGYYPTEHQAARARDMAILRYGLKQPLQILKKK